MVENFHNLGKEAEIQIQAIQRVPYKKNIKTLTLRHVIITLYEGEHVKSGKRKTTY